MKKIGIITIYDNNNYGNRLQNYAVQQFFKEMGYITETIKNDSIRNQANARNLKEVLKKIKKFLAIIKIHIQRWKKDRNGLRKQNFKNFNKNFIKFANKKITYKNAKKMNKEYDYFAVGSDQVWNPEFLRLSPIDLLYFADPSKRLSFSASFGISELPDKNKKQAKEELEKFKAISVREENGKTIVNSLLNKEKAEVLLDPTMLIDEKEWDKVIKKPNQNVPNKYILTYFLGNLSEKRKKQISSFAKENDCEIINLLDENSTFYQCGPSEFLYLEKNAFFICTDSFHSCVFSILFEKPFLVFNREEKVKDMNSRINTLLETFELKNRIYEGKITNENLIFENNQLKNKLEEQRKKSKQFFKQIFI